MWTCKCCFADKEISLLHNKVDLVITLGGDGTVLWVCTFSLFIVDFSCFNANRHVLIYLFLFICRQHQCSKELFLPLFLSPWVPLALWLHFVSFKCSNEISLLKGKLPIANVCFSFSELWFNLNNYDLSHVRLQNIL